MYNGGEAADQIVRMSLQGVEVTAKITGEAAKNIAILAYSILKEEKKTKGKARLANLLRSGKELKVFTVKNCDLKEFTQNAKKYGVLYCVLADRKNKDPDAPVDIIARAEDAGKINRIVERFNLASEGIAPIMTEIGQNKDTGRMGMPGMTQVSDTKAEMLAADLMGISGKEETSLNPLRAKTEKSPPSEPTSGQPGRTTGGTTKKTDKKSVRETIHEIREERKGRKAPDAQNRVPDIRTNAPLHDRNRTNGKQGEKKVR